MNIVLLFFNFIKSLFKRDKMITELTGNYTTYEEIPCKVICLKEHRLADIIMKKYEIYDVTYILYDNGHKSWHYRYKPSEHQTIYTHKELFITLAEFREQRINKILE